MDKEGDNERRKLTDWEKVERPAEARQLLTVGLVDQTD